MKQLDDDMCRLASLAIQCCLSGAHQIDEKGWSKEAYVQLCSRIDVDTAEFLIHFHTLWNKMTNVRTEMMSALPDDDAKASTDTKTEVTLNESDTEIIGASKYLQVVLPSNEQPGFIAAVFNPGFYIQLAEQKADLTELMTSFAATYNSPDSDKLICLFTQNEVENFVCTIAPMNRMQADLPQQV